MHGEVPEPLSPDPKATPLTPRKAPMDTPITDGLARDVITHRPGALNRLIEHAKALEAGPQTVEGPTEPDVEPLSIAQEAEKIISGARREAYGPVTESFEVVARLWAPILGAGEVTPQQVAACMMALKMARQLTGAHQRDNFVDMVGYSLLWAQIEAEGA